MATYIEKSYMFEDIKKLYAGKVGKTESMYTVVLFGCSVEDLLAYTEEKNQTSSNIKDSYRRARAKTAYYNLKLYAETIKAEADYLQNKNKQNKLNKLIMMDVESNLFDIYSIGKHNVDLLESYGCQNIWVRCTDHFDTGELYDYLESDKYYNIFRIKNSSIRYVRLGLAKKRVMDEYESKTLDVPSYINTQIGSAKYLAYGVSSKLAALIADKNASGRAYIIMNHDVSDADAIFYISRMEKSDILDRLDDDLALMQNPKTMDRILFKKDFIGPNIAKLQRIYIDDRMVDKFYNMCRTKSIGISFEVITIDHNVKDFIEGRELRLMAEFGGVIGITYY